jgi:hypothetical protein
LRFFKLKIPPERLKLQKIDRGKLFFRPRRRRVDKKDAPPPLPAAPHFLSVEKPQFFGG